MWDLIRKLWKTHDLRNKILFIVLIMLVFRVAAHIPIPGVDAGALQSVFSQNQVLGLLNVFSGGALENFSIVLLGVGPYITASIIFQLLQMIVPQLEEMSKEAAGQQKIQRWTRLATVPLAALQGYGTITLLHNASGQQILSSSFSAWDWIVAITVVTTGSVFLMWLGELISEKHIGNGVSLIIFAGIIASIPSSVQQTFVSFDSTQIPLLLGFVAVGLLTIAGVVYVTEAQRNIPISHARHHSTQGQKSHLPLRVNQAGVIPIIFAVSLVLAPSLISQYLLQANLIPQLQGFFQGVISAFNDQRIYGLVYFVLVFIFSYFYTSVIFKPDRIAENLQRQGSFVPGIRPGKATSAYLQGVSNRILLAGALFLGVIAVLPLLLQAIGGGSTQNIAIGGTSLLIVVSVAIETVKQIEAQLMLREYEQL